jgi:hypothetical protein
VFTVSPESSSFPIATSEAVTRPVIGGEFRGYGNGSRARAGNTCAVTQTGVVARGRE